MGTSLRRFLVTFPHHFLKHFLSGIRKFILYLFCPSARESHFVEELLVPCSENGIRDQGLVQLHFKEITLETV